jgi:hypothetical protein
MLIKFRRKIMIIVGVVIAGSIFFKYLYEDAASIGVEATFSILEFVNFVTAINLYPIIMNPSKEA